MRLKRKKKNETARRAGLAAVAAGLLAAIAGRARAAPDGVGRRAAGPACGRFRRDKRPKYTCECGQVYRVTGVDRHRVYWPRGRRAATSPCWATRASTATARCRPATTPRSRRKPPAPRRREPAGGDRAPPSGGGRLSEERYELPPERLGRWLDRWAEAHGGLAATTVDDARARRHPHRRRRRDRRLRAAVPAARARRRPPRARHPRPHRGRAPRPPRRPRRRRVHRHPPDRLQDRRAARPRPPPRRRLELRPLRPPPRRPGPRRAPGGRRASPSTCSRRRRSAASSTPSSSAATAPRSPPCWRTRVCGRCARWPRIGSSTSRSRAVPSSTRRPTASGPRSCAPPRPFTDLTARAARLHAGREAGGDWAAGAMTDRRASLLDLDPDLGELMDDARHAAARHALIAVVHPLKPGPWDVERLRDAGPEHVGLLIVEGPARPRGRALRQRRPASCSAPAT